MKKNETRNPRIMIKRTDALYFTQDSGTFDNGEVKGTFCSTVGSAAIIIAVGEDEREVYEVRTEDMIKAVLAERGRRT